MRNLRDLRRVPEAPVTPFDWWVCAYFCAVVLMFALKGVKVLRSWPEVVVALVILTLAFCLLTWLGTLIRVGIEMTAQELKSPILMAVTFVWAVLMILFLGWLLFVYIFPMMDVYGTRVTCYVYKKEPVVFKAQVERMCGGAK
jgi:hypothetical protein